MTTDYYLDMAIFLDIFTLSRLTRNVKCRQKTPFVRSGVYVQYFMAYVTIVALNLPIVLLSELGSIPGNASIMNVSVFYHEVCWYITII